MKPSSSKGTWFVLGFTCINCDSSQSEDRLKKMHFGIGVRQSNKFNLDFNYFIQQQRNTDMQHYQLTLKIKNEYVNIKLSPNDTKKTIHAKILQACSQHNADLHDLVNKIQQELLTLTNRAQAQQEARQIAKSIVSKIYKEDKSPKHSEWAFSQIAFNSRVKSCASDIFIPPEKLSYQKYIQTEQTQPAENKSSKKSNNKSFSSYSLNKKEAQRAQDKRMNRNIELKKQERGKKMSLNVNSVTQACLSKQQKENKKKCNPDMIKACEAIMKKSNNNAMKIMAKEFLKEKGYLAEDVISHEREKRRTYLVSQVSENPQQQRVEKQNQIWNRRQRVQTVESNVLVQSQNVNVSELSSKNVKGRSKYNYNIAPNTDIYSYSLHASSFSLHGKYQNEPRARISETSQQKCGKKYNYLQN